jgi:hypothetical protein
MSMSEEGIRGDGAAAGISCDPADRPKRDYQVGFKRPPLENRFKPGQSGNPKGRPKGTPNHRTTIAKVVNEKVSIREGQKIRKVTKFEAMVQAQANKGMQGDPRCANMVISVMGKMGLLGDGSDSIKVIDSDAAAISKLFPERPGDVLFEGVDDSLLSDEEKIELAEFAEMYDRFGGLTAFSTGEFERIKQIMNKGRVKDLTAA